MRCHDSALRARQFSRSRCVHAFMHAFMLLWPSALHPLKSVLLWHVQNVRTVHACTAAWKRKPHAPPHGVSQQPVPRTLPGNPLAIHQFRQLTTPACVDIQRDTAYAHNLFAVQHIFGMVREWKDLAAHADA